MAIVSDAVCRALDAWPHDVARRLIVGISGGGDSNVMLTALVQSERLVRGEIVPIIVHGPDMQLQLKTAHELCDDLDCPLTVVDGAQAARLAGIHSVSDFFLAFEAHYPDTDIDFAWTWLLRRTLAAAAHERAVPAVAIGANREELLSEGFLRLARGLAPMPAPYRWIGSELFVYPMCEVPKKIGDGAYPRRSLDNYEARTPSVAAGRSTFYQLAYLLADHLPGMDMTLLAGFNDLGAEIAARQEPIVLDAELDDHIADRMSNAQQRERWRAFLAEIRTDGRPAVKGYTPASYGDSFADEDFEEVFASLPDPEAMIELLADNAGGGPVLELGVGTGRVARPLAARGIPVDGIDASDVMLAQLRRRAGDLPIRAIKSDLADFNLTRRYSLVFCIWNTFYSLRTSEQQSRCFQAVADALLPGGLFVIEAFVPAPDHFAYGQEVRVREITAESVSLQVSLHDPIRQTVASQHVVIRQDGVRLHPHEIRYAWPSEIDAMANSAGLRLKDRWAGWRHQPFDQAAREHVSVYEAVNAEATRAAVSAP